MKGKLILTDIQSPVEGMQIVYKNTICKLNLNFDGLNNDRIIDSRGNIDLAPRKLSELKQIVVEYWDKQDDKERMIDGKGRFVLPLHPDDWKWAIEHINEEVEFDIDIQDISDYNSNPQKLKPSLRLAKLIHTTPATYTEEEFELRVIKTVKHVLVKSQQFELAAMFRDAEREFQKRIDEYKKK